jgi:hypothetical protein
MTLWSNTTMFRLAAGVTGVFAFGALLAAARGFYGVEFLMVLLGIYPWSCAYRYLKRRETFGD